jgi:hypothetical protein
MNSYYAELLAGAAVGAKIKAGCRLEVEIEDNMVEFRDFQRRRR